MAKIVQNKYDITLNIYGDLFNITSPKDGMLVKILDASADTRVAIGSIVVYQYVKELINTNPWVIFGTSEDKDISTSDVTEGSNLYFTSDRVKNVVNDGSTYNHKHEVATISSDGFISKEDKAKLNSLENYTLPVASSTVLGGVKIGNGITSSNGTISASGQMLGTSSIKSIMYFNNVISENLNLSSGTNGLVVGPVTISDGFSVSVADGSRLVVL